MKHEVVKGYDVGGRVRTVGECSYVVSKNEGGFMVPRGQLSSILWTTFRIMRCIDVGANQRNVHPEFVNGYERFTVQLSKNSRTIFECAQ